MGNLPSSGVSQMVMKDLEEAVITYIDYVVFYDRYIDVIYEILIRCNKYHRKLSFTVEKSTKIS